MHKYIIARNASNRPTLQHAAPGYRSTSAVCGQSLENWTRIWSDEPIKLMLCLRCSAILAKQELPNNVTPIRNSRRRTA